MSCNLRHVCWRVNCWNVATGTLANAIHTSFGGAPVRTRVPKNSVGATPERSANAPAYDVPRQRQTCDIHCHLHRAISLQLTQHIPLVHVMCHIQLKYLVIKHVLPYRKRGMMPPNEHALVQLVRLVLNSNVCNEICAMYVGVSIVGMLPRVHLPMQYTHHLAGHPCAHACQRTLWAPPLSVRPMHLRTTCPVRDKRVIYIAICTVQSSSN